jgi:hypothetical protein
MAELTAVLDRLRDRAESNPDFADTLERLAAAVPQDPFAPVPADVREVARAVNRQRQQQRLDGLRARALTTAEVVQLLVTVSDRKGVDRRRKRGTLLGIRVGRDTLHPAWQFDRRRGDTYAGLDRLLAALREVSDDPIDIDAIAVDDSHGRSIADALAAGDVTLAVKRARLAGDQS